MSHVWSESLLPATALASIIAGDSLHRVRSPALSAPRPILKGPVAAAHFHAVAAPPRQNDSVGWAQKSFQTQEDTRSREFRRAEGAGRRNFWLGQVGVWGDGVGAAVRGGPDQDAGFGLGEVPAAGLLGAVMHPAQRRQIALAGGAALVIGEGVVQVAACGGTPASGEGAGPLPGADQVLEPVRRLVSRALAEGAAGPAFEPVEPQPGQPRPAAPRRLAGRAGAGAGWRGRGPGRLAR